MKHKDAGRTITTVMAILVGVLLNFPLQGASQEGVKVTKADFDATIKVLNEVDPFKVLGLSSEILNTIDLSQTKEDFLNNKKSQLGAALVTMIDIHKSLIAARKGGVISEEQFKRGKEKLDKAARHVASMIKSRKEPTIFPADIEKILRGTVAEHELFRVLGFSDFPTSDLELRKAIKIRYEQLSIAMPEQKELVRANLMDIYKKSLSSARWHNTIAEPSLIKRTYRKIVPKKPVIAPNTGYRPVRRGR